MKPELYFKTNTVSVGYNEVTPYQYRVTYVGGGVTPYVDWYVRGERARLHFLMWIRQVLRTQSVGH